jgi:hypothetical protein
MLIKYNKNALALIYVNGDQGVRPRPLSRAIVHIVNQFSKFEPVVAWRIIPTKFKNETEQNGAPYVKIGDNPITGGRAAISLLCHYWVFAKSSQRKCGYATREHGADLDDILESFRESPECTRPDAPRERPAAAPVTREESCSTAQSVTVRPAAQSVTVRPAAKSAGGFHGGRNTGIDLDTIDIEQNFDTIYGGDSI